MNFIMQWLHNLGKLLKAIAPVVIVFLLLGIILAPIDTIAKENELFAFPMWLLLFSPIALSFPYSKIKRED
jgi:hypothetical protein